VFVDCGDQVTSTKKITAEEPNPVYIYKKRLCICKRNQDKTLLCIFTANWPHGESNANAIPLYPGNIGLLQDSETSVYPRPNIKCPGLTQNRMLVFVDIDCVSDTREVTPENGQYGHVDFSKLSVELPIGKIFRQTIAEYLCVGYRDSPQNTNYDRGLYFDVANIDLTNLKLTDEHKKQIVGGVILSDSEKNSKMNSVIMAFKEKIKSRTGKELTLFKGHVLCKFDKRDLTITTKQILPPTELNVLVKSVARCIGYDNQHIKNLLLYVVSFMLRLLASKCISKLELVMPLEANGFLNYF
jgi:hypothetical protein